MPLDRRCRCRPNLRVSAWKREETEAPAEVVGAGVSAGRVTVP